MSFNLDDHEEEQLLKHLVVICFDFLVQERLKKRDEYSSVLKVKRALRKVLKKTEGIKYARKKRYENN